jgi:hypothetical protein
MKSGAIFVIAVLMLGMLWEITLQRAWDQGFAAHKPDAQVLPSCTCTIQPLGDSGAAARLGYGCGPEAKK